MRVNEGVSVVAIATAPKEDEEALLNAENTEAQETDTATTESTIETL